MSPLLTLTLMTSGIAVAAVGIFWATRGVFSVAVLNIGAMFEVKLQHARAQNMSFSPVKSDFEAQFSLENLLNIHLLLGLGQGAI